MMLIWQCSSCKWGFSGEWQKKCPACGIDDYWTGSVHPDAKDWYETGYKPPPQAAPDARPYECEQCGCVATLSCTGCGERWLTSAEAEPREAQGKPAPDARALAAAIGMKYAELEFKMRGCKVEAYISRVRLAGLIALAVKEALLPTAPPAETAELTALKEAARSYAKCRNAQNRDYLAIKALALVEAEREEAGGGKA